MQIKEGHQEMIRVALFVLILVLIVPNLLNVPTVKPFRIWWANTAGGQEGLQHHLQRPDVECSSCP
jgi:hypothetical protein